MVNPTNTNHNAPNSQMEMLGTKAYYTRHPDDMLTILKDSTRFPKTKALERLSDWIGNGLVSNVDAVDHAVSARRLLAGLPVCVSGVGVLGWGWGVSRADALFAIHSVVAPVPPTHPRHQAIKEVLLPAFKAAQIRGFVPAFVRSAEEVVGVLSAVAGQPYGESSEGGGGSAGWAVVAGPSWH